MKFSICNWIIIFWMLVLLGYMMPEYNGSLNHFLIVIIVAIFLAIFGALE